MYAFITVSISSLLLTFWAKPSDNREIILPRVIRYGAPVAALTVVMGLSIYLIVYYACVYGYLDTDAVLNSMAAYVNEGMFAPDVPWTADTVRDEVIRGESVALVFGKNAMLMFLLVSGILQLMLLFPPCKALNWDTKYRKTVMPTVLVVLLLLLLAALYFAVPWFGIRFLSLVYFDYNMWVLVIAATAIWYAVLLTVLRGKAMKRLDAWSEKLAADVIGGRFVPRFVRERDQEKEE